MTVRKVFIPADIGDEPTSLPLVDNHYTIMQTAYKRLVIDASPLIAKFICHADILGYSLTDLLHSFDYSSVPVAECFDGVVCIDNVNPEKFDELLNDLLTDAFIDIANKTSFLSDIRVFESVDFSDFCIVRITLKSHDGNLIYKFPYSSFYPLFRIFDAQSGLSLLDLLDKDVEQINEASDHDLIGLLNGIFMQFGSR